jgi:hypothetical protein
MSQWHMPMDVEPVDVYEVIHNLWESRQASLGASSGTKFLCPNCEQMKPFAGEHALEYYTDSGGVTLVCNECLLDFHVRHGIDRLRQM